MTIPDSIRKLVKRFDEQSPAYLLGSYNETQVRIDFIDPFFKALGWDIHNNNDYAEAYRDVIHEDMVLVGTAKKAPDYSFRVGGMRKFFVEAKRPSVSISGDPKPAFQLRRYGWSAKLPISILTDFEEFAVYDCTHKPEENHSAAKARLYYYKYTDYEDKWDEIYALFSKEAILKGSFDKFADAKKKGTTTVDEAFLSEIEGWRQSLASNILQGNQMTQRDLNLAVQLIIDRVIFLRICEDRGIELYERLLKTVKQKGIYQRLTNLFKDADDKYNSGLFHFNPKEKNATDPDLLTLKLKIDDAPLREIVESLYPPNPYEFSVIPADILGQIYERFLGKVIRVDGKKAIIEEKPEVKKAGGVYYTPSYIVEHIVKETVDSLLEGKTPKQVEKLKILDPACGSGSFLIVAYQHLLDWHLNYFVANGGIAKFKKELRHTEKGALRLTTQVRKAILLNNIFGVDIDAQAVEVTKLSLLLKVLEGETGEAIGKNLSLFHERALPDLGNNIKCGNSLIGSEFHDQGDLPLLTEEDVYRINAFDWQEEYAAIFKKGKFDVVLGNPPYGATLYPLEKKFLQTHYKEQSYQLDSYLLFMELSIKKLLHKDGLWGMIIPNPWISNIRQDKLRRLVMGHTAVKQIVHFRYSVFRRVVVDTEIVVLQNGYRKNFKPQVHIVPSEPVGELLEHAELIEGNQDDWLKLADKPINVFLSDAERRLRNKIFKQPFTVDALFKVNVGVKPYQIGKGKPAQTKDIVENRTFDASKKISNEYRQYLRGRDIGRFEIKPLEQRFLRYGPWLAEPRPSANFDAITKILVRQTGDEIIAALDDQQFLCLNNLHVLAPHDGLKNLMGILALLNCKLMTWCLRVMNPEAGEALAEVKKEFVELLPIPNPTNLGHLEKIATSIIKLKTGPQSVVVERQIKMHIRQIDAAVYALFGLTSDEVELLERRLT
ncbi:N-6 DNA methylase [Paeniroseomonas aquatica]|uniref:site-specific DNA-methyltransferase (adenine-specific) n=2 Tax=Paeniroseomonas aquatica TaxID=373043 RepID=A0ABT8A612_9PROT|nr:N-6 DNA methylase [Paeniroseomonas aquatica]MDN3564973.1 N-6 DNA methylase [Paeniroseomonas aquatica]